MKGFLKNKHVKRTLIIILIIGVPISSYWGFMYISEKNPLLNFEVVEKGKLLRTGQPRIGDLKVIMSEEKIGTIISLRNKEEKENLDWIKENNIKLVVLKMKADDPPTPGQVGVFFDIMRGDTVDFPSYTDSVRGKKTIGLNKLQSPMKLPFPVLIHCEGGADRAGVMVALYQMAFQGLSVEEAKKEMKSHWHIPFVHPAQFEFLGRVGPDVDIYYGSRSLREEFKKTGTDN
jgi:protein tyrosine/serine phosphatase